MKMRMILGPYILTTLDMPQGQENIQQLVINFVNDATPIQTECVFYRVENMEPDRDEETVDFILVSASTRDGSVHEPTCLN